MSQAIIKLQNGNKVENTTKDTPPKNLIEYGPKKYEYSELENAMLNNSVDSYLANQGITGKAASEVKDYVDLYARAFKEGKIKRNPSGKFDVYDESLITDTNPVKRGVFGRIKGDKKRLALGYVNSLFSKMNEYAEPSKEETPSNLQKFSYGFGKQLRKDALKGNTDSEYVRSLWYANPNKWDVAQSASQKYRESLSGDYDFSDTPFKNKDEYLAALDKLDEAISSKDSKALQTALYNIGEADLYNLFRSKEDYDNSLLTPEQRLAKQQEIERKQAKVEDELGEMTESELLAEEDSPEYLEKMEAREREEEERNNQPPINKFQAMFQNLGKLGDTSEWSEESAIPAWKAALRNTPKTLINSSLTVAPPAISSIYNSERFINWLTKGRARKGVNDLWNWTKNSFIDYINTPVQVEQKGGKILKAQQGSIFNPEGKAIRNTNAKSTYDRNRDLLGNDATISYLNGLNLENYNEFNEYEDLYDQNYTNNYGQGSLAKWGTQKLSTLKLDPRTKNMQFVWNSRGLNNPIFSGFTGVGNSGDRPDLGEDGRFGNMTIQRTLGRGVDDNTASSYNKILNKNGLEFYKDPIHGGYRIRPLNNQTQQTKSSVPANITGVPGTIAQETNKTVGQAEGDSELPKGKRYNITSDMLGDARFLATQFFNNRMKYNPAILTTDAPELYAKVQYNLPAEAMYSQQAGRMRRFGAQSATADQTRNFAQQLEAERVANDLEGKGRLANLETYGKTSQLVQEVQNKNIIARTQNANANRVREVAGQEAKAAFQRAKDLKRGQNLSNWLYSKQQGLVQREAYDKALGLEELQQQLGIEYNAAKEPYIQELRNAQAKYEAANRNNPKALPYEQTEEYRELSNRIQSDLSKVASSGYDRIRDYRRRTYGSNLGFTLYKKGGALTYAEKKALQDAKDYNKSLRDNEKELNKLLKLSITEGNKTIRGISNYSAQLIKNSLKV
jgi:hypothetical protein